MCFCNFEKIRGISAQAAPGFSLELVTHISTKKAFVLTEKTSVTIWFKPNITNFYTSKLSTIFLSRNYTHAFCTNQKIRTIQRNLPAFLIQQYGMAEFGTGFSHTRALSNYLPWQCKLPQACCEQGGHVVRVVSSVLHFCFLRVFAKLTLSKSWFYLKNNRWSN